MSEVKKVDARGLSCPQPAMMAREAIQKLDKGTIEVLVDTGTAKDNVTRLARKSGWAVTVDEQPDGSSRIVLNK